jgi:hypothetical protein
LRLEDALPCTVGGKHEGERSVVAEVVGCSLHAALVQLVVVGIEKLRILKKRKVAERQLRVHNQLALLVEHYVHPAVARPSKNLRERSESEKRV